MSSDVLSELSSAASVPRRLNDVHVFLRRNDCDALIPERQRERKGGRKTSYFYNSDARFIGNVLSWFNLELKIVVLYGVSNIRINVALTEMSP